MVESTVIAGGDDVRSSAECRMLGQSCAPSPLDHHIPRAESRAHRQRSAWERRSRPSTEKLASYVAERRFENGPRRQLVGCFGLTMMEMAWLRLRAWRCKNSVYQANLASSKLEQSTANLSARVTQRSPRPGVLNSTDATAQLAMSGQVLLCTLSLSRLSGVRAIQFTACSPAFRHRWKFETTSLRPCIFKNDFNSADVQELWRSRHPVRRCGALRRSPVLGKADGQHSVPVLLGRV